MTNLTEKLQLSNNKKDIPSSNSTSINNDSDYIFGKNRSSIDSLKIRIPAHQVSITNDILNDDFGIVSLSSGELMNEESFKKSAYFSDFNGIKTYYRKERQNNRGGSKEFVTILLSSKTLGQNYFEGISRNTISDVYDYICNDSVIKLKFDDFCLSECTDIDVKCDVVPRVDPQIIIKDLYARAIPKKLAIEACSVYGNGKRSKKNLGIQFSLRKTPKFRTAPYLKFYEKIRELKYKSIEFSNNYFQDFTQLPSNILRAETTIKNKDHLKFLRIDSNKFIDLCDNIDELSLRAFKHSMTCHLSASNSIDYDNRIESKSEFNPKPIDFLIKNYIKSEMFKGITFRQSIERCLLFNSSNKHQKYSLKKRISKLEKIGFISGDVDFKDSPSTRYFDFMGFGSQDT